MHTHFQLDDDIIHLNHAAVAPWPVVTRDAVIAFANENTRIGSQRYDSWMTTEQNLKQKLRRLINADSSDEIALLKNTSEGLSMISQGLDLQPGENIVFPAEEFPSNRIVWQALADKGVELRAIAIQDEPHPEQALIAAMDKNTRLLSCSSVQFARGLRLDLQQLGEACKQQNILYCVDAIQSLGALQFDVNACQADFVVADGHKWMCGPEGSALFYCRESVQPLLKLQQYGWHMLKNAFDFSATIDNNLQQQITTTAQRFECGSPNMMGITALNASVGLLLDIGIDKIQRAVLDNTAYMIERMQQHPAITILSPTKQDRYAGIFSFSKDGVDNQRLYHNLQAGNIICALRGDGIRFSPHFHTTRQAIDKAIDHVMNYTD